MSDMTMLYMWRTNKRLHHKMLKHIQKREKGIKNAGWRSSITIPYPIFSDIQKGGCATAT
jgi:hypothetical protein